MKAEPDSQQPALSIVKGPALETERGLGALTMPAFCQELTARFSEREAIVFHHADGIERWTYARLRERAIEIARALIACGIGKDSRVGILMSNRPEWVASFFGIGLAGGVAVALSTFSTPSELEYLLQKSCVSVLLYERSVAHTDFVRTLIELDRRIETSAPGAFVSEKFPFLTHLAAIGDTSGSAATHRWADFLSRGAAVPPDQVVARAATVTPADAASIFFSSGTTDRPKGILNSHRAMALQCWRMPRDYGIADSVRCWSANSLIWSNAFVMSLGIALVTGGALILQRFFEPAEALELMQSERVTAPIAWPHQWAQLAATSSWSTTDLSSLRYVASVGAPVRHPTITSTWIEPCWAYGNTETFQISVCYPSGTSAATLAKSNGIPRAGNTLKIVDPATGETIPRLQRGEIAIKGPTLMLGYLGIPLCETLDEHGFFHTGDGGYLDEQGRLFWEGRLTDLIKTGGANVSPVEVDGVLATCPDVRAAKTVGIPDDTLGEMVVCCVVRTESSGIDETGIRDFLRKRLASYKVPRRVLFVREEELSFTASAKIKSGDLRTLVQKRLQPSSLT